MGGDEIGAFDKKMTPEKLEDIHQQYQERTEAEPPEQQPTAESGVMFPKTDDTED